MKKLYIVGLGPGNKENMTLSCITALKKSLLICGYKRYIELISPIFPQKEYYHTQMTKEKDRCLYAIQSASSGTTTSIVCSGDACIYALASLCYDLAKDLDIDIEIVSGVTAAIACQSAIGSILTNDFAVISLSNILTPQKTIEKRLRACNMGDFVVAIYNPCSKSRKNSLIDALKIMKETRPLSCPCGYVKNYGRKNCKTFICTLEELEKKETSFHDIDMFSTVFIGNSNTRIIKHKGKKLLQTQRGYNL